LRKPPGAAAADAIDCPARGVGARAKKTGRRAKKEGA